MNRMKVLSYFFMHPDREIYSRELARVLKMSPATVGRILQALHNDMFLEQREERIAIYYKASVTNEFKALKKAYTVSYIESSGALEYIKKNSVGLSAVLLYGSAARGEDTGDSDFDFLVISSKSSITPLGLGSILHREVNLQVYNIAQWKKISESNRAFYLDVISDSITLFGQKPVID
jgi:predicted nucleotidyltransferase